MYYIYSLDRDTLISLEFRSWHDAHRQAAQWNIESGMELFTVRYRLTGK